MKKLDGRKFAGKCDVPHNSKLAFQEILLSMTPEQRAHRGFPAEYPTREESPILRYDRGAREDEQRAYRQLLRNFELAIS